MVTEEFTRNVANLLKLTPDTDVSKVGESGNGSGDDDMFTFVATVDGLDFHVEVTGPYWEGEAAHPFNLSREARRQFIDRYQIGRFCIEEAAGNGADLDQLSLDGDDVTYAKDAISDILTVIAGAAGTLRKNPDDDKLKIVWDVRALEDARELLDQAYTAWTGDAEDYDVKSAA